MKRKMLFILSLSLIAISGIGLFWLAQKDAAKAESNTNAPHPLAAINEKAKAARTGNQTDAEDLVGEIIRVASFENELRGFTADSIKERVGRAESRYRLGQLAGIPESKIVRTINGLAKKFDLPAYARTNSYEVRKLRLELLPNFPQLINQKSQGSQPVAVGSGLDPQMSPAEAFLVLSLMAQQKLFNPEYQLTDAERRSRWKEMHNHRSSQSNSNLPRNRSSEMRDALQRAVNSASASDAWKLSDITLNTLGIEQ